MLIDNKPAVFEIPSARMDSPLKYVMHNLEQIAAQWEVSTSASPIESASAAAEVDEDLNIVAYGKLWEMYSVHWPRACSEGYYI